MTECKLDVFVSKTIRTKNSETLHLKMEPMHPQWESYQQSAQLLLMGGNKCLGGTFGSLQEIYDAIQKDGSPNAFLSTRNIPDFWQGDAFGTLCEQFQKIDLTPGSSKREELRDVTNASSGLNVRSQTHIVYATTRPVEGPIFPRTSTKSFGWTRFLEMYGDIVMSVGVTIYDTYVENRGIFRNPLSIIANNYRNIAMDLHRFTCECVRERWPRISSFRVRPMQKMAHIFIKSLPQEKIRINGKPCAEYQGDFGCEQTLEIGIADFISSA